MASGMQQLQRLSRCLRCPALTSIQPVSSDLTLPPFSTRHNPPQRSYMTSPTSCLRPPQTVIRSMVARQSTSSSSNTSEDLEWLWPVDSAQMMFRVGHRLGARFTVGLCTLNSASPLQYSDIQKALLHLQRKTPVCQVGMRERNGQLWWYKPQHLDVDFKILEKGTESIAAIDQVWKEGFNEAGPLMKARLIPAMDDEPCHCPELKEKYPHQYNFFNCHHHGYGDGFTVAHLTQKLLDCINDVIEGSPIDDAMKFGEFVPNDEAVAYDAIIRQKLLENEDEFLSLKKEVFEADKEPILFKAFPPPSPGTVQPCTKHIDNPIEKDIHQKFLKNCKAAGVSFGTAFQAVINTAIVEMVRDAGIDDESFDISVNLPIDLRRYVKPRSLAIHGLHARTTAQVVNTKRDVRDHFWEYANQLHQTLSSKIKSGRALQQDVVRQMVTPAVTPEEFYAGPPAIIRDYGFNSLGDLQKLIPGNGKHVMMTDLSQYSTSHLYIYMNFHQIFNFRGRCKHTISYATDYMTDDTAQLMKHKINQILHDLSQ